MKVQHALEQEFHRTVPKWLRSPLVARLLGIPQTIRMLRSLPADPSFVDVLLAMRRMVGAEVQVLQGQHLPEHEPVIVAANHPFPIQDTYCLGAVVEARHRGPVKVITDGGGALLTEIAHLGVFTGETRAAIRKLAEDVSAVLERAGAVCIFPSAEATYRSFGGRVVEADWKPGVIRMARKHGVRIVPAFVRASTGTVYNACRNVFPRALVRTFNLRQAHKRPIDHTIVFGEPLCAADVDEHALRAAVHALSHVADAGADAASHRSDRASRVRFDELVGASRAKRGRSPSPAGI